jgi:hypothetical protein
MLSASARSRLFPKPHGPESLIGFSEGPEADHPSVPELEHPARCGLGFDPAALAAVVNATDEHGDVAHRDPFVHVGTHDLPRFAEVAQVLPRPVMAAVRTSLTQLGEERVPLDLGIRESDQAWKVSPAERLHDLTR